MSLKSYIGDKAFYKKTLALVLPMIIQNAVTNFVNMLDNFMVGSLGDEAVSGVAIDNQFIFIFNLAIFGAVSAAGIFTAQFNGRGDTDGVRNTMRMKLIICLLVGIAGMVIFSVFGDSLINSFIHDSQDVKGNPELVFECGKSYLIYMIIGLIPFAISQAYASTLRETGETFVPMVASGVSVATNFVFNALLIFGLFGFPKLGVAGAAIATTISRFIEVAILVYWTHRNKEKCPFIVDIFRNFSIPLPLVKQIAIKGAPILLNEFFWSLSVTMRNQCYSERSEFVVTGISIAFTLQNLLSVAYFALSSAIAIIVGNLLGEGKLEEAKETDKKLLAFATFVGGIMTVIQLCLAPLFPMLYNVSQEARDICLPSLWYATVSLCLRRLLQHLHITRFARVEECLSPCSSTAFTPG